MLYVSDQLTVNTSYRFVLQVQFQVNKLYCSVLSTLEVLLGISGSPNKAGCFATLSWILGKTSIYVHVCIYEYVCHCLMVLTFAAQENARFSCVGCKYLLIFHTSVRQEFIGFPHIRSPGIYLFSTH